jgi:hypothetical protein
MEYIVYQLEVSTGLLECLQQVIPDKNKKIFFLNYLKIQKKIILMKA